VQVVVAEAAQVVCPVLVGQETHLQELVPQELKAHILAEAYGAAFLMHQDDRPRETPVLAMTYLEQKLLAVGMHQLMSKLAMSIT
jgi:hypothetical protein